jgi:hypothetical protein
LGKLELVPFFSHLFGKLELVKFFLPPFCKKVGPKTFERFLLERFVPLRNFLEKSYSAFSR